MSRIGNKPIPLPKGVKVNVAGRQVTVESSKGRLSITHRPEVTVRVEEARVVVERKSNGRTDRAMHGLTRALINNMVIGVTDGFKKELEINGVGWTANVQGKQIALNVGYADTRKVAIPDGVSVDVKGSKITISGVDKQAVGQLAAVVRSQRPPEPYNAKGIKYADEQIVRKQGKQFAGGGA
jgi:large subunit ribosomal protein L6